MERSLYNKPDPYSVSRNTLKNVARMPQKVMVQHTCWTGRKTDQVYTCINFEDLRLVLIESFLRILAHTFLFGPRTSTYSLRKEICVCGILLQEVMNDSRCKQSYRSCPLHFTRETQLRRCFLRSVHSKKHRTQCHPYACISWSK